MMTGMQTILITGGAGYIGSVLVPMLLSAGHKVVVIDQFYFGRETLPEHPLLHCIQQDSRSISLQQLNDVDCIIDLAAMSNDPCGETFARLTSEVNHLARFRTARLAKEAGVKRYILPSSCSVYGYQPGIATEESATNPLTHYARANLAAEQDILPLASSTFCVTAVRLATVFGDSPRMRLDLVVNAMTYDALRMQEIHVSGGGTQTRPLIHVSDAAGALATLAVAPCPAINRQILNVGSNLMNYTINDIAEAVSYAHHVRYASRCRIIHNGPQDLRNYRVDFDRIRQILGWQPAVSLETGIETLIRRFDADELCIDGRCHTLDWYSRLQNAGRLQNEVPSQSLTLPD